MIYPNYVKQSPVLGLTSGAAGGASLNYFTHVVAAPPGGDDPGSVSFDGTDDHLNITGQSDLAFGTGDFTLECWAYFTSSNSSLDCIMESRSTTSASDGFLLGRFYTPGYENKIVLYTAGGYQIASNSAVSDNTWVHIAVVRNNPTTKLYIDGVAQSTTYSDSNNYSNDDLIIGENANNTYNFDGLISNFRMVKGTSVYTSNFAVPTAPLTNITNTKLLCCNSTTSATGSTITPGTIVNNGGATVSTSNPFNFGSVQFDGSNDYLSIAGSNDFDFGTGDFTIEGFFYKTTTTTNQTLLCSSRYYTSGNNGNWILRITNASNIAFASYDGTGNAEYTEFSASTSVDTWYHFALVRSGTGSNQTKFYLNGTLAGSMTVSKSLSDAGTYGLRIGEESPNGPGNNFMNGYLSNIRIIKGTALYTSNFTAPTSSLTNVTNTKLLCCQSAISATAAAVSPGFIFNNGGATVSSSPPFSSSSNSLITRFDLTGSSLNPSTDDFSSSLLESDGSFGGSGQSQYYEIDSRTTAGNRLAWSFDFSSVSSYDHFAIQFEYYWDYGDSFKTTFSWQSTGSFPSNLGSYFRTDRGSSLYSGRWMGRDSYTASSTWGQTSSTWIEVVGYHNINNNTGYLKFDGTKRIEGNTNADATHTYYTSADKISFAQFVDDAAGDNGIRMRLGVIQISCWNGQESDMPAFNGRFT